jgi:hypothetical protein
MMKDDGYTFCSLDVLKGTENLLDLSAVGTHIVIDHINPLQVESNLHGKIGRFLNELSRFEPSKA